MKWIKTHNPKIRENYLKIHYNHMDTEMQDIVAYLEAKNVLMGRNEAESRLSCLKDFAQPIRPRKSIFQKTKER